MDALSLNVLISPNPGQSYIQLSTLFKDEELFQETDTLVTRPFT